MSNIRTLFNKYMSDSCTTAEVQQLMHYFSEVENETALKEMIAHELLKEREADISDEVLDERLSRIYGQLKNNILQETPVRKMNGYLKYAAAAVLLLAIAAGLYLKRPPAAGIAKQVTHTDITPGGNRAMLTLADGSRISLTDAGNGKLAQQAGITITKTKDGELLYEPPAMTSTAAPAFNTITTQLGGQYQVTLSDGTKVWLNAGTQLKYPAIFTGTQRKVIMEGEAYFEVAKDDNKPFIVESNGQVVKVLGTRFNINSYKEEGVIKTTLIDGAVSVSTPRGNKVILQPGQQAVCDQEGIKVNTIDTELAVDWKNGNFYFTNENIQAIMRKLSRWYDVAVVYKGTVPEVYFGGEISRSKPLSEILTLLETTGKIHFTIEGRKVIVMP